MGRPAAQGQLRAPGVSAHGLLYTPADTGDDADLRALLREQPMDGWVSLTLEREPDYFSAAALEGDIHQSVIVREARSGEAVGMYSRSVDDAFLNGRSGRLGYLGQLRVVPRYRRRIRHLRDGFAALRQLFHDPVETPFYLTSIVEDNRAARRVLAANLPGLPTYRAHSAFLTLASVPAVRYRRLAAGVDVEPAGAADLPAIAACLQRNYRRYQFAPVWTAQRLRDPMRCANLHAGDFLVVRRAENVAGCVALWDQRPFKQTVVRGYATWLARLRPFANAVSALTLLPTLPPVGSTLGQVFLSHLAADNDDPLLVRALLGAALAEAARRGFTLATVGGSADAPWVADAQTALRCRVYRSHLYTVAWDEEASAPPPLDERPAHVEIATL